MMTKFYLALVGALCKHSHEQRVCCGQSFTHNYNLYNYMRRIIISDYDYGDGYTGPIIIFWIE